MSISNCIRCNRIYHKAPGVKICPDCLQAEDEAARRVRDHLDLYPETSREALLAETGVEPAMLTRLVRAGRFVTMGEAAMVVAEPCRQCGTPQIAGKTCAACTEQMGDALRNSAKMLLPDPKPPDHKLRRP